MSKETRKVLLWTDVGNFVKKSVVSFRKLGISFVKGLSRLSRKLLSLLVRHEAPAIIGLSLRSITPGIFTSEEDGFSHAVVIEALLWILGRP